MSNLLQEELAKIKTSSKIFFAVLNWGLGHATRSTVIIQELIDLGHEVHLGSDGEAGRFLREAFPALSYHSLPSYDVEYRFTSMFWNMLLQGPKVLSAIAAEQKFASSLQEKEAFDLILSDNRYGVYHSSIPSILISHQLRVLSKPRWTRPINAFLIQKWLSNFNTTWIPDAPNRPLSGQLSLPSDKRLPVRCIGPLSYLSSFASNEEHAPIDIVCLLSGPEPQRSKLEEILLEVMEKHLSEYPTKKVVLIRGKISNSTSLSSDGIQIIDFCKGAELATYLSAAKLVICRSGYSSIMDLEVFGKEALFIPTPGQPEQEYLAKHISNSSDKYQYLRQNQLQKVLPLKLKELGQK